MKNKYKRVNFPKPKNLEWETNEFLITNKKDWKKAQHFFKSRLLEFDIFYQEYKDVLINLIK